MAARNRITHWDSVPSLWAPVLESLADERTRLGLPDLTTVVLAGEAPRPNDINTWLDSVPNATVINAYGPTEATVDVSVYTVTDHIHFAVVPIGTPLPGVSIHVLDAAQQPCEPHLEGELYIQGPTLAREYLNDPSETAAAFVSVDIGDGSVRRLYRTGDLGYRLADGNLVCTGRRDRQTKINGVRIEPAEVELALQSLPGVTQVVACAYSPTPDGAPLLAQ